MKLEYLHLSQFRQFRNRLQLDGLAEGINLFVGPNESGKSTVADALRAAFFERYNTTSVSDLQPWGDSAAAPEIELAFVWQDERWVLKKRFLKQARCDLQRGSQHLSGAKAEDALAELFGYAFASRGASKAEHHGIPGLLWVEQGSTQELDEAVAHAGDRLNAALAAQVGDLASSSGDAVIAAVEQQRAQWLTPTGKPTGDYRKVTEEIAAHETELAGLDSQIAHYRQQVDQLDRLRRQQQDIDAAEPWEAERQKAAAAQKRLDEIRALQLQQQQDQKALDACRSRRELYHNQLDGFAREAKQLEQRAQARKQAQEALDACQKHEPKLRAAWETAQAAWERTEQNSQLARKQAQRILLQKEHDHLAQSLHENKKKDAQAAKLQTQLTRLREQLQANALDEKQLDTLETIQRQLDKLQIQQAAVATRLQYELAPDKSLALGDDTLTGQGERQLVEEVELHIPDVGRLRLTPGGGADVAELARQQRQLQQRSIDLQQQLDVPSLDAARQRAADNRDLARQIKEHEIELRALAPEGTQALAEQCRLDEQRLVQLTTQLQQLPEPAPNVPDEKTADATLAQVQEQLKAAEQAISSHKSQLAVARQALDTAQDEWQRLSTQLAAPGRAQREQEASKKLIELKAEAEQLDAIIRQRRQQISDTQPDILAQDVQRHTRSAEAMRREADDRKTAIIRLETELQTQGAQGLEEKRDTLAQALAQLKRRHDELAHRTRALDLLLDLLRSRRNELTRQLQAPLQEHLQRYLQLLFPRASLSVNEQLLPDTLIRDDSNGQEHSAMQELSFGAREQMGLLSRLAYADLLRAAGKPTLIVLDDALVHSDAERLAQMKRILFDAATRHQILLFSCHPERWRDLGVAPRDLQGLKTAQISP